MCARVRYSSPAFSCDDDMSRCPNFSVRSLMILSSGELSILPLVSLSHLVPSPGNWQSTRFLQRTLIHSARLGNTWTTEPLTLISSKRYTGLRLIDDDRFQWVCGRWLIVSKDMKQLRSRDVETGSERLLWDHGSFAHWGTTSVIIPQGRFIYVVVHLRRGHLAEPVYVSTVACYPSVIPSE